MRIFIATTLVFAAALASARAEPNLSVPPGGEGFVAVGKICPMIFMPVCGIKHHRHHTYTNSCFARVAGARHVKPGACHKTH